MENQNAKITLNDEEVFSVVTESGEQYQIGTRAEVYSAMNNAINERDNIFSVPQPGMETIIVEKEGFDSRKIRQGHSWLVLHDIELCDAANFINEEACEKPFRKGEIEDGFFGYCQVHVESNGGTPYAIISDLEGISSPIVIRDTYSFVKAVQRYV